MVGRRMLTSGMLVALALTWIMTGCAKKEMEPADSAATGTRAVQQDSGARMSSTSTSREQQEALREREEFQNRHIFFAFDRFDLSGEAQGTLDQKVAYMGRSANLRVQIEGHCDERGTNAYNLALGEKRANTAKKYMVAAGVNTARLNTISYGEERPMDPGHTEAAWSRNRRAQFVITQ